MAKAARRKGKAPGLVIRQHERQTYPYKSNAKIALQAGGYKTAGG